MRKMIAGILAGLVLGTTGTAVAAQQYGYWHNSGNDYKCQGYSKGVYCNSGGYQVGVTTDYVFLKKGTGTPRDATTVGCEKWKSWASCYMP